MKRRLMPLALAACLALAGCTSLPTSSAPAPFDVSAKDGSGIQFSAEGPSADADAATLVNDFLLACAAGPQDDYATARLFLSAASARSWQPETEILVYDTDTAPSATAAPATPAVPASAPVPASFRYNDIKAQKCTPHSVRGASAQTRARNYALRRRSTITAAPAISANAPTAARLRTF